MPVMRLAGFSGANKNLNPKALPEAVGVDSLNQKPGRGDLRPWKSPTTVATVPGGRQTIYRMGRDAASDATYWLSWTGKVHATRGFDAENTSERTFYTGDGAPKVTDTTMALASAPYPTASRPMGLPAPETAPTVVGSGGVSDLGNETYFYVYTYVNDWGWESAPSPVSAQVDRKVDGTTAISGFAAPPAGNYSINRMRIYRTQAVTSGSAEFFFLREVAYPTTSTTDDNRALGEVCPTVTWLSPPDDLTFLTPMWNGMLAGISSNAVRFCEAYVPYAWPVAYDVIPPDGKPVALAVFGQNLLVLTTGRPLLVAGSSPDSMDQQPLEIPQACVSANSAVSMGSGVAWASNDGLMWYGAGGARNLTAGLISRDDWLAMNPAGMSGRMYEGLYFGACTNGTGFVINPTDPQGIYFLSTGYAVTHFDELQDQLYVLSGANVQRWDAGTPLTYTFKSKVFRHPKPSMYACAEVVADAYPVTLKVYADGVLKHTQTVASANPFRLPAGFRAVDWQLEVTGANPVQGVVVAGSMEELAQA